MGRALPNSGTDPGEGGIRTVCARNVERPFQRAESNRRHASDAIFYVSGSHVSDMATSEALLVGRERDRAVKLVGGFAAFVALAMVAAVVADLVDATVAATLTERVVPLLVFYAPAPVAALGAYARCGGPACLAVGIVPAVVFAVLVAAGALVGVPGVGGGDAPLGSLTVGFAIVGVSGAFLGYCVGVAAAMAADLLGVGSDDAER